ncbi:unnamed protein product [Absidia cylindrospora]
MTMGIVALSGSLLFVFSFVNFVGALCFHWPHPAYFPLILLQTIFLGILFLVYRRLRYTKIRRTYQRLLRHLQQIIDVAGVSDHLMDQLVDKIHDVETISQGYTLTPANSVLKQPRSHQSPQTIGMQSMARSILVPYFKSVTALLQKTSPLTHSANLSTLRGMYNVKALSSTSPLVDEDDDESVAASICQEQLDYLVYMIRSTRREWFMRLLALEMMTLGHDSARRDYGTMLDVVEGTMLDMEHYTKLLTKKMKKAMASDLYNEPINYMDDKNTDQRSRVVLNKLVLLEKHLRNLQTKIVLCRHDANGVSHDKGADQSFNRINDRFGSMEQDISHLLAQWDENKNGLLHIIKDERKTSTGSALPSPPTSPAASMNKVENSRRPRATTPPPATFITSSASSTVPSPSMSLSSASSSSSSSTLSQSTLPHISTSQPALAQPSTSANSTPSSPTTTSSHQLLSVANTPSNLSSRQSWITAAAVASFLESRRVYRLQTQQRQQEIMIKSDKLSS